MSRKTVIVRLVRMLFVAVLPMLALADAAEQQHERIERLERAVLAPCCYTESVAVHQSEIAVKMRLEITRWVAAGKSDQEILATYEGLYGAKVIVDPRTMPRGWMPFVPWFIAVIGAFWVAWILKRWSNARKPEVSQVHAEGQNLPDFEDE